MSKHTPAPWWVEVDLDKDAGPYAWPIIMSKDYEVVGTEGLFGDFDTDMANARLIASAPELLEALKVMTDVFQPRSGEPSPDMHVETVAWEQARQVIAKAEGQP